MIRQEKPSLLLMTIPGIGENAIDIELSRVSIIMPDIRFEVDNNKAETKNLIDQSLFYRGNIKDNPESLVSLSIVNNEVSGMIIDSTGTRMLGQESNISSDKNSYLLFNDKPVALSFICSTLETEQNLQISSDRTSATAQGSDCKYIGVYLETDKSVYDKFGTREKVTGYILSLFNQVATLYAAEGVALRISGFYLWDTLDPYAASQNNPTDALNRFRSSWNLKSDNFPGQIAHLISCRPLGGGQAHIGSLDTRSISYGVSAIQGSYQLLPTYSWDVKVIAHELGHNIGSPHTHACSWPGGAIDNCAPVEGNCVAGPAPVQGGTIMSYCQNTASGINLAKGFGVLPGNLIRAKVAASASLPVSNEIPSGLFSAGYVRSARLKWNFTGGNFSYMLEYKPENSTESWTQIATSHNEILLSDLTPNTTYVWRVSGNCSGYSETVRFSTNDSQPVYCQPADLCVKQFGVGIQAITVNGQALSISSDCSPGGYSFHNTAPVPQLVQGKSGSISISLIGYSYPQYVKAWIDYNNDGEFTSSELISESLTSLTGSFLATFNVSDQQILLSTRLRVRTNYFYQNFTSCENLALGETEDYTVQFIPDQPLPVKFVYVDVFRENEKAVLKWKSVDEDPGLSFEIEKSLNAKDFIKIGSVPGYGLSVQPNEYLFSEELSEYRNSVIYYRIKMREKSGGYTYSRMVSLNINTLAGTSLTVWPNPFTDHLLFSIHNAQRGWIAVKLFNIKGILIKEYKRLLSTENQSVMLDNLASLPPGTYLLEISDEKLSISSSIIKTGIN